MKKTVLGFILASLCLFAAGCWGPVSSIPTTLSGKELTLEQRFTLKDLNGDAVQLDQVLSRNKAVVLDFWATWCTYCVEAMPELKELQEKYASRGFTILAVNVGESREVAGAFSDKEKLNFPVLMDEDMSVSQAYGIVGIPFTLLVDSKGRVVGEFRAGRKLEQAIEKTLSAEPAADDA